MSYRETEHLRVLIANVRQDRLAPEWVPCSR